MTYREAATYVGKLGVLHTEGLRINVRIIDARKAYGRIDVLVEPIGGEGEAWVVHTKVEFILSKYIIREGGKAAGALKAL